MDDPVKPHPNLESRKFFVVKLRCDIDVKHRIGIIHGQSRQTGDRVLQRKRQHWSGGLQLACHTQVDKAAQSEGRAQLFVYEGEQFIGEVLACEKRCG